MAAPPNQRYRQISFLLTGGTEPDQGFTFALRPEELNDNNPTRLAINQTLGGAWPEAFGKGVRTITLSGHNGWRGGLISSGEDLYLQLRAVIFDGWHLRRRAMTLAGKDPTLVELIFTDNLNGIRVVVVPRNFSLHRSRSRPLLMMYNIQLDVISDAYMAPTLADEITDALSNPLRWLLAVTGLTNILTMLGQLQNYITNGLNVLGAARMAMAQAVNTGVQLFTGVASIAREVTGIFSGSSALLLGCGAQYATAMSSGMAALAGDDTLPMDDRIVLMQGAATFNDAACTMANGFSTESDIQLLTPLFGASACSSTGGGDAASQFVLTGASPFESMNTASDAPVTISSAAQSAMLRLNQDPILLLGQTDLISGSMSDMASGVTVSV